MHFECEKVFHIYTRANSEKELLFREDQNYFFFLRNYRKFMTPIFETLCYCLIPNHYHLLVKVKDQESIFEYQEEKKYQYTKEELKIDNFLQQQIANFHISYAKAYNKKYERRGSLFQSKPKAKEIPDINYLLRVARYIHRNPLKHGLINNLKDWEYSSFLDYADLRKGTIPKKEFFLSSFSSVQDFINFTKLDIDDYEDEFENI